MDNKPYSSVQKLLQCPCWKVPQSETETIRMFCHLQWTRWISYSHSDQRFQCGPDGVEPDPGSHKCPLTDDFSMLTTSSLKRHLKRAIKMVPFQRVGRVLEPLEKPFQPFRQSFQYCCAPGWFLEDGLVHIVAMSRHGRLQQLPENGSEWLTLTSSN